MSSLAAELVGRPGIGARSKGCNGNYSNRVHLRQRSPMLALTDAQLQIVMATAAAVLPSD
jgi:hypothetical protein